MDEFVVARRAPKLSVLERNAPSHLREDGSGFFASMCKAYEIDGPAAVEILTRAAECIDRIAAARSSHAFESSVKVYGYSTSSCRSPSHYYPRRGAPARLLCRKFA